MLKIWGRANSINVQKVLWCCGELGLQYHRINAGNEFGVTKTPEYRVLNPNGFVPTIEDGDFQLWESNVIVRYLAQKSEDGRLYPADIRTRFDAERWMDWQATVFWPALRPLFIELIRTLPANRDVTVISRAESLSLAAAQILDARLSDRTFLAGESFSIGDIPAATTVHRWYALDIHHPELPNLQRWYDLMKQRRPFQEVVMTPLS
jgi:glutathione S-transferase